MKVFYGYLVSGVMLVSGAGALWTVARMRFPVPNASATTISAPANASVGTKPSVDLEPLLQRNLFHPGRTPILPRSLNSPGGFQRTGEVQLVGLVQGEKPIALVRGLSGNPNQTALLALKEQIAGVTLLAVFGDSAVFEVDSDTVTVGLVKDE